MAISDEIALMKSGRIVQLSSPRELYERPGSVFVADFIGKTNLVDGIVAKKSYPDQLGVVQTGDSVSWHCRIPSDIEEQMEVVIGIRSEDILFCQKKDKEIKNCHPCKVIRSSYLGDVKEMAVELADSCLLRVTTYDSLLKEGQKTFMHVNPNKIHCFEKSPADM
jgi:ABC-type Fe3+/spermidine/putrescine transport system ATPase subunit